MLVSGSRNITPINSIIFTFIINFNFVQGKCRVHATYSFVSKIEILFTQIIISTDQPTIIHYNNTWQWFIVTSSHRNLSLFSNVDVAVVVINKWMLSTTAPLQPFNQCDCVIRPSPHNPISNSQKKMQI